MELALVVVSVELGATLTVAGGTGKLERTIPLVVVPEVSTAIPANAVARKRRRWHENMDGIASGRGDGSSPEKTLRIPRSYRGPLRAVKVSPVAVGALKLVSPPP